MERRPDEPFTNEEEAREHGRSERGGPGREPDGGQRGPGRPEPYETPPPTEAPRKFGERRDRPAAPRSRRSR